MAISTKSPVTASVSKAKLNESTGLILADSASDGKIRISGIKYGSLFWSTRLKNGYQIVSINGISCEGNNMTADLAARIIRNSKDVTVVAVDDGTTAVNPKTTRSTGTASSSPRGTGGTSDTRNIYPSNEDVPPPIVEAKMISSDDSVLPSAPTYEEPDIAYNPMAQSAPVPSPHNLGPPVYVPSSSTKPQPQNMHASAPMQHGKFRPDTGTGGSPPSPPTQKIRIAGSTEGTAPPSPLSMPMPSQLEEPIRQPQQVIQQCVPNATTNSAYPPPGVADGGVWGKTKEVGDTTWLVCVLLCLFTGLLSGCGTAAFCCPCDEKDAYKVNDRIYSSSGQCIGSSRDKEFTPIPRYQQPGVSAVAPAPQVGASQLAPGTVTESVSIMADGSRQTVKTTYNSDGSKIVQTTTG